MRRSSFARRVTSGATSSTAVQKATRRRVHFRRARDELGCAVLLVEHDMAFVRALADETTVLDLGRVLVHGPTDTVLADEQVAAAYLGSNV